MNSSAIQSVTVFCGSSTGSNPAYIEAAKELGTYLGQHNTQLVYGGARVGLMGAVADATLEAGGHVVGILPKALADRELAHTGIQELIMVDTMHQRKALMAERGDAFIALPGGAGTLEEMFEIWTWGILGYHHKPFGFYNVDAYYDHLNVFLNHTCEQQFIAPHLLEMLAFCPSLEEIFKHFQTFQPPKAKWET